MPLEVAFFHSGLGANPVRSERFGCSGKQRRNGDPLPRTNPVGSGRSSIFKILHRIFAGGHMYALAIWGSHHPGVVVTIENKRHL